jgi:hypothetical protein
MVLDRRSALAGLLLSLVIAGCGASHGGAAGQAGSSTPVAPSSSTSSSIPSTPLPASPTPSGAAASTSPPVRTSLAPAPSSTITVPAYLCSGTDVAQNAADAFMGALSAGNAAQAMACVQPHTVPVALTRSLLASSGGTASYLPRDGVNGPSVFGYRGYGKLIDVTVKQEGAHEFRVVKVVVKRG